MEDKIRLVCSVCQSGIRVRAATKAKFAICPKCQARTPIPEREAMPQGEVMQAGDLLEPPQGVDVTSAEAAVPEGGLVLEGESAVPQGEAVVPQGEPVDGSAAAEAAAPVEAASAEEPQEEEAGSKRKLTAGTRRGRLGRGRRGGGDEGGEEGGAAARYRPAKKGFNPILLAIPAVLILLGGVLFMTGFFDDNSKKVIAAGQQFITAVKGKRLDSTWRYIQKKTQDEAKEADRNEIRDFYNDLEEFTFEAEIVEVGPNGDKWDMKLKYSIAGKLKVKDAASKPLQKGSEEYMLSWMLDKGGWIIVDDTHKGLFARQ
ncbi:MAG TPA: hypothetical protein VI643_04440 [Planctomycetota bacterium]|nr:hypothetical protein [Planctomycetota bacterium]